MPDLRTFPRSKYDTRVSSFFKTSGITITAACKEDLTCMLYCNIMNRCISQGLPGHATGNQEIYKPVQIKFEKLNFVGS